MDARNFHLGLILLLGVCAIATPAQAQDIDPERYARVKAGYVLNFLRLSSWPEEAFQNENSPIQVVIVGQDDMVSFLRELLRDEQINGRRVFLRQVEYPRPRPGEYDVEPETMEAFERTLQGAHLLYVARDQRTRVRQILDIVEDLPVLTVSDIDRFAENGGMLGLAVRQGRVAIDAHAERIRESGVTVSSRLLRLARIVQVNQEEASSG
jgi:hypothetical protein